MPLALYAIFVWSLNKSKTWNSVRYSLQDKDADIKRIVKAAELTVGALLDVPSLFGGQVFDANAWLVWSREAFLLWFKGLVNTDTIQSQQDF